MMHLRRAARSIAAALALSCGACVTMQHPFSNDETSVADERLIGLWQRVPNPGEDPEEAAAEGIVFRKRTGTKNTLEAFPLGNPQVDGVFARAGDPALLSIGRLDQDGKIAGYEPMKYDLPDRDTLRLHQFQKDIFCAAVDRGELAGEVKREEPQPVGGVAQPAAAAKADGPCQSVFITADPADVLKFIEKHGDRCFDPPLVLRRIAELRAPPPPLPRGVTN